MRANIPSPSGSTLYPIQTWLGCHIFSIAQLDVSLWLPLFVSLRPQWPVLFLIEHDEGELRSHMLFGIAGQAHLPTPFLLMTGVH
jgi:hypothetical protein